MNTQNGNIFLINNDKTLSEMLETPYEAESLLQKLLDEYPSLIAGEQINSSNPRKWLTISREMGVPSKENGGSHWYIDHLFVDQDAIPTFIEVKRSTDTRIRREVVGQMLDYAANATVYWSIDTIKECFMRANLNSQDKLDDFLDTSNSSFSNAEEFWSSVESNLSDGIIRLLFVADKIPKELYRIIEFLNDQMTRSEVLGVEIKQYTDGDLKTLVSRVLGQSMHSEQVKQKRTKRKWDKELLVEDVIARFGRDAGSAYSSMISTLEKCECRLAFGEGLHEGSVFPVYDGTIGKCDYFIFSIRTKGSIEIQLQHIQTRDAFVDRNNLLALRDFIQEKLGIDITDDQLDKRPKLVWNEYIATQKQRQSLVDVQLWINNRVKEYENNL